MTYITCSHPRNKVIVKTENVKALDLLRVITTPKPYCESCKSYLPVFDSPGRELVNFWFIRQDGRVTAKLST